MKLYGKKALALIMAMAMTLSMCSMTAFAADPEITDIVFTDWDSDPLVVPYGTDEDVVASLLPESAEVEFDDSGEYETWRIGRRDELDYWEVEKDGDEYICTTAPDYPNDYDWEEVKDKFTLTVETEEDYTVNLTYTLPYSEYENNSIDLDELIADLLMIEFEKFELYVDSDDVRVDDYEADELNYGEVEDLVYSVDLDYEEYELLIKDGSLIESAIEYKVSGDVDFDGKITITLFNSVKDFSYAMGDQLAFYFGDWFAGKLDSVLSEDFSYVTFSPESRNSCGTLYADEDLTEFDESEAYYYGSSSSYDFDLEALYFVSHGEKDEYEIEYWAYDEDDELLLEGTVYIECSEFLYLEVSIASDETYTFDAKEFEDLVEDWDDDYTLVNLDNISIITSNGGNLYYEYDEDDKKHTPIDSTEEYFASTKEDDIIDDITYVPSTKTKGAVMIEFDARVKKSQSNKSIPGYIQINVEKKADITVEAGINALVQIDPALFQDYLDKDTNSTKYDVAYVTITNGPKSANAGYLYTDGAKMTTGSSKTFYADPKSNQNNLNDLYFQAGAAKYKTSATFKVYYYKTSSKAYATNEGTIDFIVGESTTMSGELDASKVMSFGQIDTLRAFANLGGNNNFYVSFDRLPVGGKLVYNWGTTAQEDVKAGTAYYITSNTTIAKQVSKITFVPSYSASKTSSKTVTIPVTCYNALNKAVTGTINITVKYAQYSTPFNDITTSTYADSVDFLFYQGITTGATATTFNPNGNVKRAEFVTFLWRAAGKPEPSVATVNKFTDVKASGDYAYAYKAILWAVEQGITTGTSATTFSPADSVTHQQLITFLYRYDVNYLKHYNAGSSAVSYVGWSSMAVDHYAYTPARWAAAKGILTDSTTYPTTAGTRATVALWLHRMLTL